MPPPAFTPAVRPAVPAVPKAPVRPRADIPLLRFWLTQMVAVLALLAATVAFLSAVWAERSAQNAAFCALGAALATVCLGQVLSAVVLAQVLKQEAEIKSAKESVAGAVSRPGGK